MSTQTVAARFVRRPTVTLSLATPTASPGRLLLVEPAGPAGRVASDVLRAAGHDITVAADGGHALETLRGGAFDVVVTAWELPGPVTAEELCRTIRADEALDALQVIALTAQGDTRHLVAALDAGADDHVATPFAAEELVARVKAALRIVRLERERAAAILELRIREAAYRDVALEQTALRRVAATVASARSPEEVFSLVAREVARLLGCEGGGVARFVGEGAVLEGAYSSEPDLESWVGMPLDLGEHWVTADVLRTGAPARVDDYGPVEGGAGVVRRSSVAAPIRVGGHIWGTVGAVSLRPEGLPEGTEQRLGRFAELVSLAIANAQARHEIAEMAMRDPLTGLHNRRAFEDQLARQISAAARHGAALAMVIIDVDRFKAVNDTHGHQVGDMVLIEVAHRLANVAREEEPVARLGGEEFVWLLPGLTATEAMAAAERARVAVASVPFATVGAVTVSAGIAELDPALGAEALFRRADDALYAAKDAGRNRCVVWAGEREPA